MKDQDLKRLRLQVDLASDLVEAGQIALARISRNEANPGATALPVEPFVAKVNAAATILSRLATDAPLDEIDAALLNSLSILARQADPAESLRRHMTSVDAAESAAD